MIILFLLLGEFIILSFLSRKLTQALSTVVPYQLLALLFSPGVVIHELAHFLMAAVLLVPVSDMEFVPKKHEGRLKLGSVSIGQTDPFRRAVIGVAPVIIGLAFLFGMASFISQNSLMVQIILLYLVFAVANTMFSSPKDMEGFLEVVLFAAFIGMVAYIFTVISGMRLAVSLIEQISLIGQIGSQLTPLAVGLGAVITIDAVVVAITSWLNRR